MSKNPRIRLLSDPVEKPDDEAPLPLPPPTLRIADLTRESSRRIGSLKITKHGGTTASSSKPRKPFPAERKEMILPIKPQSEIRQDTLPQLPLKPTFEPANHLSAPSNPLKSPLRTFFGQIQNLFRERRNKKDLPQ